jgi:ribonuclease R
LTKTHQKPAPFPSREQILDFINESQGRIRKREIARAFRLDSEQRVTLKKVLREMHRDGLIQRGAGRRLLGPGTLPPVTVIQVTGTDTDGELLARPLTWRGDGDPPVIYLVPEKRGRSALGAGDRALARLRPAADGTYEARVIRRVSAAPALVLGIYGITDGQGRLSPTDRRSRHDFIITRDNAMGARAGDLVRAEVLPGRRLGLREARVIEHLAATDGARSVSLIAIHDHDIPTAFSDEALVQAAAAGPAPRGKREDLRGLPLVTIDGADARDFDDAVWTEADPDAKNPGGWHLLVAIADVAWYVRPGDALDVCAYERGNSAYFPDRVVPMLPEALSNGWCSLNPGEERPCMAVHLWIDAAGALRRHRFVRATMRSAARLTYSQVQAARDGEPDTATRPLLESVITPLYGAYETLAGGRRKRGALELDLPERRVVLDEAGDVARVEVRERFDSHRLIEEFMITANVAAAEALEALRQPCMYRVHDAPADDKLESLRTFLDSLGMTLARGQVIKPAHFNRILARAADTPNAHLVNEVVLRSQAQAAYAPGNIGHFGLGLRRYAHFTSPIRRYADLLVHRALIRGAVLGEGGLEGDHRDFAAIGEQLSMTERRAAVAERDAVDRFTAAFLADKVGRTFAGRVNGVTRFGLFVTLDDSGGDGLVPISTLPSDYYDHDDARHCLKGQRTGRIYRLGDRVEVLLTEADPVTGGMILQLMDGGAPAIGRRRSGKGRAAGRGARKPR